MAAAPDDNVVIESLTDTYTVIERDGKPYEVKNTEKSVYTALNYDDAAGAVAAYGRSITIEKASAPGSKPIYRQWIDDDDFYSDSRVCLLPLELKAGKKTNVEFRRTFTQPEQFCKIMLTSPHPVRDYTVVIDVPAALASRIKVTPYRLPDGVTLKSEPGEKGGVTYSVNIRDMKPSRHEKYAPASPVIAPALLVTGVLDGVDGLYRFLKSHVPDDPTDGPVAAMAAEVTAGLDNDLDKANAIASWVRQNIRYVAIEHGEWVYRPDDAASCLAKRYGDCKCSANLIKTMLRSVGIDGRFCWIGTASSVPHDWNEVPALCSGNHCIAAAVIGDSTIYLDGTTSYSPAGYLTPSIQGRPVLVEDGDNVIIGCVPTLPVSTNTETYSAAFALTDDRKALSGRVSHIMTGCNRFMMANAYYESDLSRRQGVLESYLLEGNKSRRVSDVAIDISAPDSPEAVISAVMTDPSAVTAAGEALYVRLSPVTSALPVVESRDRTLPVSAVRPCIRDSHVTLTLPADLELVSLPEPLTVDNDWYTFTATYRLDNGGTTITADYRLVEKGTPAEAGRVDEYSKAVKNLNRLSANRLTLKKKI